MGDISSEPSMEEILSSIKRIIAEEGDAAVATRTQRAEVLELGDSDALRAGEPAGPPQESILSDRAAEATRGPLEALSRIVVKPEASGSDTIEGLVREMLKPMLRDWLDTNLPRIVEAMVSKEISRITGRD